MQLELSPSMQRQEGSNDAQQRPRNGDVNVLTRSATCTKKRPWYERALDGLLLCVQPAVAAPPAARAAAGRPPLCSSVKAAASAFARVVCLCAPVCAYDDVLLGIHVDAVAPTPRRRSGSYSGGLSPAAVLTRAKPLVVSLAAAMTPTRPSVSPEGEGTMRRPSFRGKSLSGDALMRRFVLDEQAVRRPGEKEAAIVKEQITSTKKWEPRGKSRLRRMSLADVDR